MRKILTLLLVLSIALPLVTSAQKKTKKCCKHKKECVTAPGMLNNMDTVSYLIGTDIARNFKTKDIELNYDMMFKGMKDGKAGVDTLFTQDELQQILMEWNQRMYQESLKKDQNKATENKASGIAFLAQNKTRSGVIETASGLQYEIIKQGDGETPDENDMVEVNYTGTLIDGTVFDATSRRGQPVEFAVNGVIPGWTEGLQLMKEGAVFKFFIPANLAYGDEKVGTIPPGSTLIFEVELLEVEKK